MIFELLNSGVRNSEKIINLVFIPDEVQQGSNQDKDY